MNFNFNLPALSLSRFFVHTSNALVMRLCVMVYDENGRRRALFDLPAGRAAAVVIRRRNPSVLFMTSIVPVLYRGV